MYDAVIRASQYFFDTNPLGRIINRFSKDIGYTDDLIPETFYEFLHLFIVSIAIVIVNVVSMPWILIGLAPLTIVFWCARNYYLKTARELKRLEAIGRSPVFIHFSSTLEGISTIRSLSLQNIVTKELSTCQDHHTEAWFLFLGASRWLAYRLEFLCFLFVSMAAFAPLFIAEKQRVDGGIVGLALTYALVLTGMFQWCVRISAEVENQMTSVERIFEYCELESEGKWKESNEELPSSWPEHGIITAEQLSLQYHSTLPRALKNVYFCIRAKEKVGIVGRTGAGKSSLMAAILRIAEPKGRLLIDGIDVTDIGLHDLRSRISVIPQDPVLFGGTLRHNLDPFNEYSDKDLWNALDEVQLRNDIGELSGGLDTDVTESGSNFSFIPNFELFTEPVKLYGQ
ncbi:Multidrug resistance-associated protein 4 [Exaiptasia diaphana]|nr:Multidrug resistance-associated protein 4 [Exaiptasia diaphana]